MTFHNQPASLEDLAFPRSADVRLAEIQARGSDNASEWIPTQGQAPGIACSAMEHDTQAIRFFVPGKPQSKGRPRAAKRGKHVVLYTPEKTVNYESTVALAASQAMAGRAPIEGAVSVFMAIALPVPASWSKKKQARALTDDLLPTTKPDADNVVKAVFDAMNGVVWADDTQVVEVLVRKRYRSRPGVSMAVSRIPAKEGA